MPKFKAKDDYRDQDIDLKDKELPTDVTLNQLMAMKPDKSFIDVPVPTVTLDRVLYDPIFFNDNVTFMPGKTYKLHPIVAKEVYRSIRNHAEGITKQKVGRTIENDNLLGELKRQEEAERVMFAQFSEAGISA